MLTMHLMGFVMVAGTTVADFIAFRQFWNQYELDAVKGRAVFQAISKFPILFRIGIILIILSGVGMMAITHGVFGEQLWFRIKFALVIMVILNGLITGRRQSRRLGRILNAELPDNFVKFARVKGNLKMFHYVQLTLLFIILFLSVFKFN